LPYSSSFSYTTLFRSGRFAESDAYGARARCLATAIAARSAVGGAPQGARASVRRAGAVQDRAKRNRSRRGGTPAEARLADRADRSEEHTSELQSRENL